MFVGTFTDKITSFGRRFDTSIMPCSDVKTAHFIGKLLQHTPLDARIALHTWVRGAPMEIFVDKIANNRVVKLATHVESMMLETHILCHLTSFGYCWRIESKLSEGYAFEFVTLTTEFDCSNRTVDASTHCH